MPSLWDEMNKVDYAAFFYKYIKRGKFVVRNEPGGTFLSLIVSDLVCSGSYRVAYKTGYIASNNKQLNLRVFPENKSYTVV